MTITTYNVGAIAAGEGDVIIKSRLHKPGMRVTPVVYCHHATGTARTMNPSAASIETDFALRSIADMMAEAGHPVIASDQVSANSWGANPVSARIDGAITRIGSELGCRTDKVLLIGDSMGTISSLNWARANPSKVAAIAILLPVPDLQWIHDNAPSPLPINLQDAYGGAALWQAAAIPAFDPYSNRVTHKALRHSIRFWYHDDDPIASPSVNPHLIPFWQQIGAEYGSMGNGGHALDRTADAVYLQQVATFLLDRVRD